MLRKLRKPGQSSLEYLTLLIFILVVFFVFQKYIVRGFVGRWKTVGDSMGSGRIYDPNKSEECAYGGPWGANVWFDQELFDASCVDDCQQVSADPAKCHTCITGVAATARCNAP